MAPDPVDAEVLAAQARNAALTRPRPGHADLAGMQKYDWDEARPILERASARETAARVALGRVATNFLEQAYGIGVVSHVVEIGPVASRGAAARRSPTAMRSTPIRCAASTPRRRPGCWPRSMPRRRPGDTLGGVVEVVVTGMPPGIGSHSQGDTRLDARLAGALMGIQAIKGVEVGDGFALARTRGSARPTTRWSSRASHIARVSNRSGGTEGGMSTGEVLRVRAAMKPIATVPRALRTVDTTTLEPPQPTISARTFVRSRPPASSPRRWWRWSSPS
jgi:chorismate synthase